VSPLRGEKPQNWPLSKLNTGRFALRAMLPVTNHSMKIYMVSLLHRATIKTEMLRRNGPVIKRWSQSRSTGREKGRAVLI